MKARPDDDLTRITRAGQRKGARDRKARERSEPNGHDAPATTVNDEPPLSDDDRDALIGRLARLPLIEYGQQRVGSAKRLRVPVWILDKAVSAERGDATETTGQGRPVIFTAPEPWPDPVDGARLLTDLTGFFADHLVLPLRAAVTLALWTLHTWVFDVFRHTPRLNFCSVTPRSGKSTALDLLQMLVSKPLRAENMTEAATFRVTEFARPTLLVDEADRWLRAKSELIGLLNAGHYANGQVIRCVGEDSEVRAFAVFAPVAIAGIGALAGTLTDRSIVVTMQRATPGEKRKRVTGETEHEAVLLARRVARWAADNRDALNLDPQMGDLFSRAADKWRPLYAIAERVGDNWPDLARAASQALAGGEDEGLIEKLLNDIRRVFKGTEMSSSSLVLELIELEDRPWAELSRGKPITTNRLARFLAGLAIGPGQIGPEHARVRGYRLDQFAAAFARCLPAVS
jgi:hypothetical protein